MHKAWSLQSLGDVLPQAGGILQISRDRDDQMGLKIKTQKTPTASNIYEKKMQRNVLNIKTGAKQVWFYFICTTLLLGYMGNPYT